MKDADTSDKVVCLVAFLGAYAFAFAFNWKFAMAAACWVIAQDFKKDIMEQRKQLRAERELSTQTTPTKQTP